MIEWRDAPRYEGRYQVSNDGRVRSLIAQRGSGVLKAAPTDAGYRRVNLYYDVGKYKSRLVHTLVAEAFIGPCPAGMEVCHRDGKKDNNAVTNLYYGTRSQNMLDKVRHGAHHNANKSHCPRGHEYNVENTLHSGGRRRCRACGRDRGKVVSSAVG